MARAPRAAVAPEPVEDEDQEVRSNPDLLGHHAAAAALEAAARSGRLAHAWLLAGPPGIGKATLGYRFLRWLLAGGADHPPTPGRPPLHLDPDHPAFRRVAAGAHADLRVLRPTVETGVKRTIRAEAMREALRFVAMTAAEGGWRGLLVDGADQAMPQALNILLKTLEEPPPRVVILLVSAAPDRLLPTIRSRCRRLDLAPLAPPDLEAVLARSLPDLPSAERARLAEVAEGSPGQAVALAEGEGLAMAALAAEALSGPDRRRWHALAEAVAAKRDGSGFAAFMALLRRAIAAGVRQAARGGAAEPWLAGRSLAEWSALWDSLGRLAAETEALSLDRKQAVLTALGRLASPRR